MRKNTKSKIKNSNYKVYDGYPALGLCAVEVVQSLGEWQRKYARNLVEDGKSSICQKMSRQWKSWECRIMNVIDFRFWFCECHYQSSYGKVVMAGCRRHD